MSKERAQFLYWNRVLFLELCVLQLIRAIREGVFSLYKKSLVSLVPCMFSLDHINYARWMSAHIPDMNLLSSTHPDIHQEFTNGSFVVHKTEKVFSSIALRRWMIAGPEVARIIQEFEETYSKKVSEEKRHHHEQIPGVQAAFKKDVLSLVPAIEDMGNPLKSTTRERQGTGTRRRVASSSKLPKNWKSFLHVGDNKTELFLFLAKELQAIDIEGREVYTTYGEFVLNS